MSCDIIKDIDCINYFLRKIATTSNVKQIIILGYLVCIIRISLTWFV